MMPKPTIVFMGTPDFAVPCLEVLVNEKYDLLAVVTQPDRPRGRGQKISFSPVKTAALSHNIPVLQPEKIKCPDFQATLMQLRPDLIVVVAFGQFLPTVLLDLPKYGCINVHASLLPHYRGAAPIHWAVINGETVTGVTTMYMDAGMDTGDMILKGEIPIGPDDNTGDVHDKLKILGANVLKQTVKLITDGTAPRVPQDHKSATYAPLLTRKTERIDWARPARDVHNLIRGLNPWPGAYCRYQDKNMKIWQTRIINNAQQEIPGRIHAFTNQGIIIGTGKNLLELLTVQPESKRRMPAIDYAHGYGLKIGDMLE
jgi:methionyl-tRNA formyltransferase